MKAIAWLLGVVSILLIIAYSYTQEMRNYIFRDEIIVRPKGVLLNSIQINRVGELGLDTVIVFKDGEQQQLKVTEPGYNKFIIYVDRQERAYFEQFVYSEIAKHDYIYELTRQQDSIAVQLRIFGPDKAR